MADPTAVNAQITDAVTQTNVKVVAEAPAQAIAALYQIASHSAGLSLQNAVYSQQAPEPDLHRGGFQGGVDDHGDRRQERYLTRPLIPGVPRHVRLRQEIRARAIRRQRASRRPGEAGRQTPASGGRASANGDVKLPSRPSPLAGMSERLLKQTEAPPPDTSALNSQVVQAVQMSNSETAGYAPSQIAIAPNMMISQASGLVAQSAASYFDGVSKIALASQAILLRQMTQNIAENKLAQAAEDALGALATDLLMALLPPR